MRISGTSNKELAAALSVHPSMISLMRTGKRKLSKNPAQAQKMAVYFAKCCSAPFQRQALSEMLDQVSINPGMPTETLATCLEHYLRGDSDTLANSLLSSLESLPVTEPTAPEPSPLPFCAPADENQTQFFFGPEGRREVMVRVMQLCRSTETPSSILTVVDDNLEWLLSDYVMTNQVQAGMLELVEKGRTAHQIVPPLHHRNPGLLCAVRGHCRPGQHQ